MNILSKDVLLDVAYIGGGATAAAVVTKKVSEKFLPASVSSNEYVLGGIPVVLGLLLPSVAGGSRMVRGIANGMLAYGAGKIVEKGLKDVGVTTGVGSVMLGSVAGVDPVMMGNADAYGDTFTSSSYDITASDSGELDF